MKAVPASVEVMSTTTPITQSRGTVPDGSPHDPAPDAHDAPAADTDTDTDTEEIA